MFLLELYEILFTAQRCALPSAGEKQDWKRESSKAQNKPKNALSPSRPMHAVLGGFFLFIYGVIDGVIATVGIGVKGMNSTGAR